VHAHTRGGLDRYFRRPPNEHTINRYLKTICARHPQVQKKKVTVSGLRATVGTWLTEKEASSKVINLTLGHTIPEIRQNQSNKHYLYSAELINPRKDAMRLWEAYCLSLSPKPTPAGVPAAEPAADNVSYLPIARRN
jgi:integrase